MLPTVAKSAIFLIWQGYVDFLWNGSESNNVNFGVSKKCTEIICYFTRSATKISTKIMACNI